MKLNLDFNFARLTQDANQPDTARLSSRNLQRRNIDPNTVSQCLDSLDIFRDLLDGMPNQKAKVVRDVCKAIQT